MRKIFLLLVVVLFCSCSTYKLANTVWYNISPAELYGEKCNIITSLYFWNENTMNINTCIVQDTTILVPATMTANGSYSAKGNLKKGVEIQLNVYNTFDNQETYQGIIKKEGMVLVSQDSIARVYNKVSNASLIPSKK